MIEPLLSIPNHAPQAGALPHYKADYLGYYDSGHRQLVFTFRRDLWSANLYISTFGWGQACATMHGLKIPENLIFSADEAQWLYACWNAAALRFGRAALENVIERQLFRFPAATGNPSAVSGHRLNAVPMPSPASKVS